MKGHIPQTFELIGKALIFATTHHRGQVRKYTNDPYITHPVAVMSILSEAGVQDEEMLCAALLHDIVEDTYATIEEVEFLFGFRVAQLVSGLTDVSKKSDGNRATRKRIDREHTAAQCPDTKTVKLADLIHNSNSIVKYDPQFARVYMTEKRLLLDEALKEGCPKLWETADKIVKGYYEGLGG